VLLAVCSSLGVFTSVAAAADSTSTDLCVGLQCDLPVSGTYVPEAQGAVPDVSGLGALLAQGDSGFYELPALVYREDVRPRAVVYLSKPGELGRMPDSVRELPAVRDFLGTEGSDTVTLIVVDHGIRIVVPGPAATATRHSAGRRHHPRARAATSPYCFDRYFCLFSGTSFSGTNWQFSGPTYAGTGWHNLGTNFGSSQVNNRDGDTLLSDFSLGDGTRYCAAQQSVDTTFADNAIGNGNASSVALLGSSPDRC